MEDANVKLTGNLYFDASQAAVKFDDLVLRPGRPWAKMRARIVADPKFVDAAHFDFRLQFRFARRPRSASSRFDYTKAGVYATRIGEGSIIGQLSAGALCAGARRRDEFCRGEQYLQFCTARLG